jgi:hypothetical protein
MYIEMAKRAAPVSALIQRTQSRRSSGTSTTTAAAMSGIAMVETSQ